jgi:hypothetical protein
VNPPQLAYAAFVEGDQAAEAVELPDEPVVLEVAGCGG